MGLFQKEKQDIHIMSVRMKGFDQSLGMNLRATYDKKSYNNYFTFERSLGKGQGYETVVKVSFDDITSITYHKPLFFGLCSIHIIEKSNDERLRDIKVERDYFDKSTMNKIINVYQEYKQNQQNNQN